ncbi:MAG: DUF1549 domain-containing protein [Pirellulaceae bacterium]|nr:DUF1549 domain-containing protein [Pirellulaceae bacterium]HJN07784.1 DUF1549 domain-containing protein [Pirellulaceae bacterium]
MSTRSRNCDRLVISITLAFSWLMFAAGIQTVSLAQDPEEADRKVGKRPDEVAHSESEPSLHNLVDEHIEAGWEKRSVKPAEISSDAEFLRRVCLDLTGIIPTADDVRAFLNDNSPEKRAKLIGRLLDSPEYALHMARVFDESTTSADTEPLTTISVAGPASCFDLHPDGRRIAVAQSLGKSSYPDGGAIGIYDMSAQDSGTEDGMRE